jgi:rhodanese-related sulfurtransferase
MKINFKEIAVIFVISIVSAFFYNSYLVAGIPYVYEQEKVADGSVVSLAQAKEMIDNPEIIFIDSRPITSYKVAHLPGAINVPYNSPQVEKLMSDIKKDQSIVIYCYSRRCNMARLLASKLHQMAYTNVAVFDEGISVWQKHKYPVESAISKEEE